MKIGEGKINRKTHDSIFTDLYFIQIDRVMVENPKSFKMPPTEQQSCPLWACLACCSCESCVWLGWSDCAFTSLMGITLWSGPPGVVAWFYS